jgi:hypothetical protein
MTLGVVEKVLLSLLFLGKAILHKISSRTSLGKVVGLGAAGRYVRRGTLLGD